MIPNIMVAYVTVNWNEYRIVIPHIQNSYIVKNVVFYEYALHSNTSCLIVFVDKVDI